MTESGAALAKPGRISILLPERRPRWNDSAQEDKGITPKPSDYNTSPLTGRRSARNRIGTRRQRSSAPWQPQRALPIGLFGAHARPFQICKSVPCPIRDLLSGRRPYMGLARDFLKRRKRKVISPLFG